MSFKGFKHSEETKQKNSIWHKERKRADEIKRKISETIIRKIATPKILLHFVAIVIQKQTKIEIIG